MAHFRYDPVKGQKIVKLPEDTDPGICDMDEGIVVICRKTDQMTVANPIDRTNASCF